MKIGNYRSKTALEDAKKFALVAQALKGKHAYLAFQPIHFAEKTPFPAFYEGLIRFSYTDDENHSPGAYISQLEQTHIGREMDCESLRLCFEALEAHPERRLSVNASALSINNRAWLAVLHKQMDKYPNHAERLIIEITESVAIPDIKEFSHVMTTLQNYGIAFAIDDFGAGHTSFRYFQELCFDIVKIDRSFVKNIDKSASQRAIVSALVAVARHFDTMIVGEGVEKIEELECLSRLGVDCLQGYYFGYPEKMEPTPSERERIFA